MKIKVVRLSLLITLSIGLLTPILAAEAETSPLLQQKRGMEKPRKSEWPLSDLTEVTVDKDGKQDSQTKAPVPEQPVKKLNEADEIKKDFKESAVTVDAPQRIIVKSKNGTSNKPLFAKYALKEVEQFSHYGLEVIEAPAGKDIHQVIAQLEKDPGVLYAEPDEKVAAASMPNDPRFNEQWSLHNTGQEIQFFNGIDDMDMDIPEAWDITMGSSDIVVAVIDTGVDLHHPDLQSSIWSNPGEIPDNGKDDDGNGFTDDVHGWDFYHNDSSVYDLFDVDIHGTEIAGIIGASVNDGIGITGVAPNVKIMPLKFMGPLENGYISDAIRAIEYAEYMGARIANLSWATPEYSQALKDAIDASKMLFVTAAGEPLPSIDSMDNDEVPVYPASYDSDNIISVAAINNDVLMWYSRYGVKSVDVGAPGANILSTYPSDRIGMGAEIKTPKYKAIFNSFGFEHIDYPFSPTIGQKQDSFNAAMDYFGLDKSTARILLVQDDEYGRGLLYANYLPFYEELMGNAGYPYDTFTIPPYDENGLPAAENGPLLDTLKNYDLVIWFTGYGIGFDYDHTALSKTDQASLTSYLQQGGNLLLTGQDATYAIEDSYFVKNMLHVDTIRERYREDDVWDSLEGRPGTAYEGESYYLESSPTMDFIKSNDPSITTINLEVPISGYEYAYGTSMAAANTSGVAALILSQTPSESNALVKERLMLSGIPLKELKGFTASGKMINAQRALSDDDITGMPIHGNMEKGELDGTSDPNDVYYVYLNAGDKLGVDLTGDEGTDYDLYVYSPSAATVSSRKGIAAMSETPGTSKEHITYVATETGYHYIDVYAYDGAGDYSFHTSFGKASGTYENTDDSLAFEGPWSTVTNTEFSGGSANQLNDSGKVSFSFNGSEIEWIGFMDSLQGTADVYIDGDKVASPSLKSGSLKTKQSIFKQELPYGLHTITIEWAEANRQTKNNKEQPSLFINVDSFRVTGQPVAVLPKEAAVRFEETNAFVQFKGIWKTSVSVLNSGGTVKYSEVQGNFAQFNFTGKKVELVANTGVNGGKANVYVDGKLATAEPVDFYSASFRHGVSLFQSPDLASGNHTIRIENIGVKNELSSGFNISVDVFKVTK